MQEASKALSVLSARSPGVREAGAHSVKGKRKYSRVAKNPREAMTPDSLAKNGVATPKAFDLAADQAPIPASLPLPSDAPIDIAGLPSGFDSLSPFADIVPARGPASFTGNSLPPSGTGGSGGGAPPIGIQTPTPSPSPTASPTPTPTPTSSPTPTPTPTSSPTPTPTPPPPPPPTPTPTPPAVPEPAEWLMLVTAFGLVGAEMRRRNRIEAKA
ncbi:hypothetical protein ACTJKY_12215 [Sphingomonas sp. 22176]